MKPRITLLTLGVTDLPASLAFYREGLGLPTPGIVGTELERGAVVFIELEGQLGLALYPREHLAHDAGVPLASGGVPPFAIAHNVRHRDEVDAVMAQARRAGATVTKPPVETFYGGYAGYFQDPDGYLWEVAWNPHRLPAP